MGFIGKENSLKLFWEKRPDYRPTHKPVRIYTSRKPISYKGVLTGGIDMLREVIRERDNWICQICGDRWQEKERRFDVHHFDEKMESVRNYHYDKHNTDKMVTLCHHCHLAYRPKSWKQIKTLTKHYPQL